MRFALAPIEVVMLRPLSVALAIITALGAVNAPAEVFSRVTSFEMPLALDTQLWHGGLDPTASVDVVLGGVDGAPPATDGERVLRISFTAETDGKVEFGFRWTDGTQSYDLNGGDALLADVFIATPSALPTVMGVYEGGWAPPDAWQPATATPGVVGQWRTIQFQLNGRTQTNLTRLNAIVFENMPGSAGVIYVDNLRIVSSGATPAPTGVVALAFADRHELTWDATLDDELVGYHVYAAGSEAGPFTRLTTSPITDRHYVENGTGGAM
ncbi:MAG: hypothetical protein KDA32_15045, partial [Phycisphaerales bacterium]|nr:hypothetical protein [Phycisphaerales bacterium]